MKTTSLKYLSPKTKVLRSDGSEVKVAELNVGDNLLGSDEDSRTVISLFPFKSQNYRIIPKYNQSFILNEFQMLPVTVNNKVLLINVNQFYDFTNRNDFCLLHAEVEFTEKRLSLEPYILGCWLSNNNFTKLQFSTKTTQITMILEFITKFNVDHLTYGDHLIITDTRIINQFQKYNLFSSPRIPDEFKFNSRSMRTRLFNGFCDGTNSTGLISIVGETLMNDFCYVANSLGFLTECRLITRTMFLISFVYNNNLLVKNNFRVAKINDQDSVCIQLTSSNEVGILLSDFTVV